MSEQKKIEIGYPSRLGEGEDKFKPTTLTYPVKAVVKNNTTRPLVFPECSLSVEGQSEATTVFTNPDQLGRFINDGETLSGLRGVELSYEVTFQEKPTQKPKAKQTDKPKTGTASTPKPADDKKTEGGA